MYEGYPFIGTTEVIDLPRTFHTLHIFAHYGPVREQAQERKLCEPAEKEPIVLVVCKPRPRYFGVNVPLPNQCKPDIGVKEIQ